MTWVSERHLVAAISNAGGFGVIASGSMSPALLDAEIAATAALTDKPFGVNLITLHPQLLELIDVCLRAARRPCRARRRPAQHGARSSASESGGARVVCFAPGAGDRAQAGAHRRRRDRHRRQRSRRPYRPGLDRGVGAGDPARTSREVPVFVAGGIGRGEAMLSYLEMGAAGRPARHPLRLRPRIRSPIRASSRPSSAPRRAMRCLRSSSTRAFR